MWHGRLELAAKLAHLEIMEGSAHEALGHGRLELAAKLAHLEIMEGRAHDTLGHERLELAAKLAHLKIMEGCAHDALGHGRLELAAKLAHFHLEIPQHIVLLLPCSFSDEPERIRIRIQHPSVADPNFPSRIRIFSIPNPHQRI
jgi:hypothetical protein